MEGERGRKGREREEREERREKWRRGSKLLKRTKLKYKVETKRLRQLLQTVE